jgi:hypothetical protein
MTRRTLGQRQWVAAGAFIAMGVLSYGCDSGQTSSDAPGLGLCQRLPGRDAHRAGRTDAELVFQERHVHVQSLDLHGQVQERSPLPEVKVRADRRDRGEVG